MQYSSTLLVYTEAWIRQIRYIVMTTKEGSTKIENFMNPEAGVLMLRHKNPVKFTLVELQKNNIF